MNASASIQSSWSSGPSTIPALDLSQIPLNVQSSAATVLDCPANPPGGDASGNSPPSGAVLQVTKGNITISGSANSGVFVVTSSSSTKSKRMTAAESRHYFRNKGKRS